MVLQRGRKKKYEKVYLIEYSYFRENHSEAPALTLILAPRMVKVSEIKNIVQEVLRKHREPSASIGHSIEALMALIQPLPIQQPI